MHVALFPGSDKVGWGSENEAGAHCRLPHREPGSMEPYLQCTIYYNLLIIVITTTTDEPKLVLKLMTCCQYIVKFGNSDLYSTTKRDINTFAFGTNILVYQARPSLPLQKRERGSSRCY